MVAGGFGKSDSWRFEQCHQQSTKHVARANHPGSNSINARVKIVQPDMNAPGIVIPHNLTGDSDQIVCQSDHMVTVPAYAAAYVQQNLRQELEHARYLISDAL